MFWRSRRKDQDFKEEIQSHLNIEADRHVKEGLGREEAAAAARRAFGNMTLAQERFSDANGWRWLSDFWRDLQFGSRLLARDRAFTATAVVSLTIGIGAVVTIFAVVNSVLLRPMPGHDPHELVTIYTSDFSGPPHGASSFPDYRDFRQAKSLTDLAGFAPAPAVLTVDDEADRVTAQTVTSNYFSVLGVAAHLGRTFVESDGSAEAARPEIVLSHRLWRDWLGSDPTWVGRSVRLDRRLYTIVGIAASGFEGFLRGLRTDVWVPLEAARESAELEGRGKRNLLLVGRVRPGTTLAEMRSEFELIAGRQFAAYPESWTDRRDQPRRITVLPEQESRIFPMLRGPVLAFMILLSIVAFLILLVACSNVAGLLLARFAQRRREMSVRLSLGAGRGRVVRQLVTESALLVGIASVVGVLAAYWASRLIMSFQPPLPVRVGLDIGLDYRVLLFSSGLALLTAVGFGLAPALQISRTDSIRVMAAGVPASRSTGRRAWFRGGLIVVQAAVATVLLIGTSLFLRSLANADAIDPGFNPDAVLIASIDLEAHGYGEADGLQLLERLRANLEALPQIESAAVARVLPLGLEAATRTTFSVEDYQPAPGEDMAIHFNIVSAGFFETLQVPIVLGRAFTYRDGGGLAGSVIVNEAFARRFWPGQHPIGKLLARGSSTAKHPMEVVGVARDGKYLTLGEQARPYVYLSYGQHYAGVVSLLVRTLTEPELAAPNLREQIRVLDEALPVFDLKTMSAHASLSVLPVRVAATFVGWLGGVALLLTVVGVYGFVGYSVKQRTKEIGIRAAIGARTSQLVGLMVRQGMGMTIGGLTIGLILSFGVTRFLEFLLYDVSPTDPLTFAGVACLLATAAFLGCLVPARQVVQIEPMQTLRDE